MQMMHCNINDSIYIFVLFLLTTLKLLKIIVILLENRQINFEYIPLVRIVSKKIENKIS